MVDARLTFSEKMKIRGRYILEMTIHQVPTSARYPFGIKYGLILIDTKTGAKVLMDNHHPKGPHVHVNDAEFAYDFVNEEKLVQDFKGVVFEQMGVQL